MIVTQKFCISIVFSFSWELKWPQEKLKTMLMQNFGVTNKEHYGMLWYFWSGQLQNWFIMDCREWDCPMHIYKITKTLHALWLGERCVCMRVRKHGCDIKMFCFSHASHRGTNLKKFLSWKLDISLVGWNLENLYKTCCAIFFSLNLTFYVRKICIFESLFLQNKNWLRMQDFANGENFSFNQCHNNFFPQES